MVIKVCNDPIKAPLLQSQGLTLPRSDFARFTRGRDFREALINTLAAEQFRAHTVCIREGGIRGGTAFLNDSTGRFDFSES
jgi:hypothetical protein